MQYISDSDVWDRCPVDYLWIYDKLILARKLNHRAAPAGIPVPKPDWYIVRPITNLRMMSRGASKVWLTPDDTDLVPDGYFWSEVFVGRHISVDYHYGVQELTVEGFRDNPDRLDRFSKWTKIPDRIKFPEVLGNLWQLTPWVNVEYVGGRIIEVHLRWNDDFQNHCADTIYPVWKDEPIAQPPKTSWYPSPAEDRTGFWVADK